MKTLNFRFLKILTLTTLLISILSFTQLPGKLLSSPDKAVTDSLHPAKINTACRNVQLLNGEFNSKALNTKTCVWVYVPEGYAENKSKYPVIYLLNGQNVFSDSTADEKEWYVDETLDSLADAKKPMTIVVAVRDFSAAVKNEDVVEFLKGELKPFIDSNYRTMPGQTIIAGAGANAEIAMLATLKYPGVFNRAGIFSPGENINNLMTEHEITAKGYKGMLFFYQGGQDIMKLTDHIGEHSSALIYTIDKQNPKRFSTPLGGWFPEFYNWISGNGFNYIIRPKS